MNRFKRSVSITLAFFCFNALSYEISSTVTFKKYSLEEIRNDFENNFDGYKPDTLRVGFVRNNFSPYDTELITMKKYYEGISADYLKLIELSTGIKINIVPFSSRNNAIEALKDEKIDLLTTSNIYESFNGLKLSIPYKEDIPALFSLNVNREKYSNSVESVGLIREYLPSKEIRRVFPSSNIILYRTPQELISALLTRKIDVMVMDLYSANYQINREFSGAINFVKLIDIESNGFSFSSNNENFINIINFIIKRVDKNLAYRLSNFWNGGGLSIPDKASLISARKQAKNLRESSEVNVVLSKYSAPISYLDKENIPRGIVIDILEAFRVITGIKLNYIFVDNEYEQIRFLNEDKADLSVLPINLIKEGYGKNVRIFNRFLAKSVYVKISRINSKNNEFNIIVYPKSKKINEFLTKEYPDKVLIEQDDYLQVLNKLEEISSDAIAIAPLITSNFYIDTYFKNRLKIDEIFSKIEPEVFHFSINKNKEDLINLNKEIFDVVTIEDMNLISNRWQKNAYPSQQTWKDFKYTIYSVIFLGGIIVILVLTGGYSIFKSYKNTLKVKDKLRNQLAFLQILIDKIPHPIYVLDQNLNLLLYNKSYFNLINEKYLDDKNIDKLARVFDNEYNDALSKNKPIFIDRRILISNEYRYFYHWIQPYKLNNYNETEKRTENSTLLDGVICGMIDISDRVTLNEKLIEAKDQANAASQAKSQFLATMSHEIRTPINAIVGLLDLFLRKSENLEFDIKSIELANDSAHDLLILIGDILDLAKIESGKLTIHSKKNQIAKCIESIYNVYSYVARQKNINFNVELDGKIDSYLMFDEVRLKQILLNIISNAIKFTDDGFVNLTVTLIENNSDSNLIRFVIEDSGIGIPRSELTKITDSFHQAHNHLGKGGSGLGLMIVKSICDLMGAELVIESIEGRGTKIKFEVKFHKVSKNTEKIELVEKTSITIDETLKVLIVDDYYPNRILLIEQINYLGLEVDHEENGILALNRFKNKKYDIVITDCNMPIMDGYKLAESIREIESKDSLEHKSYIIGYTANAQKEIKEKCLSSGMNDCLFKPVSIDILKEIFSNIGKSNQNKKFNKSLDDFELLMNNKDKSMQLLKALVEQNDNDLKEMKSFMLSLNYDSCKKLAHKMKSGANMLGIKEMISILCDIEESENELDTKIALLEKVINDVKEEIESRY